MTHRPSFYALQELRHITYEQRRQRMIFHESRWRRFLNWLAKR